MFAHSRNERDQTDVILMLTPHIVRTLNLTEDDLRPFLMGRDLGTASSGSFEAPQPLPGQPLLLPGPPQAAPAQQNPDAPVLPLLPPTPAPATPAPQGQQPTNPQPAPPQQR